MYMGMYLYETGLGLLILYIGAHALSARDTLLEVLAPAKNRYNVTPKRPV